MATHYSEKDIFPLQGGCVCGLIRYSLELPPIIVHCCSCTACQRQTGSAFAINAVVESTALTLLPSAPPTVPGSPNSPEPIPCGILPSFTRTVSATAATEDPPEAKVVSICVPSQSGSGQVLVQCPACHTTLWNYYGGAGSHLAYFRVGTLDRAWEIQPDVHIFTRSRASWLKIDDGKPQYEDYYPDRMALLRPEAKRRTEAMKDTIKAWQAETYQKTAGS